MFPRFANWHESFKRNFLCLLAERVALFLFASISSHFFLAFCDEVVQMLHAARDLNSSN
ncbi:hypothetical protein EJ08DRAFT_654872 [Tothia fuscella]|uniref:Uncharacterized protein n=1 Tax=Tothia fuscella TaxID=1048955 RepID=A0A9P4TRS7_9PEZI|nr:hypothetical protein EJ08DRAFT_654872 [Tothia fuscella]